MRQASSRFACSQRLPQERRITGLVHDIRPPEAIVERHRIAGRPRATVVRRQTSRRSAIVAAKSGGGIEMQRVAIHGAFCDSRRDRNTADRLVQAQRMCRVQAPRANSTRRQREISVGRSSFLLVGKWRVLMPGHSTRSPSLTEKKRGVTVGQAVPDIAQVKRRAQPDLPDHHCGGGVYGATGTGVPYETGAVAQGSQTGWQGAGQAATGGGQ